MIHSNKGIWVAKNKAKSRKRLKIPAERNPTNDFGYGKKSYTPVKKTETV